MSTWCRVCWVSWGEAVDHRVGQGLHQGLDLGGRAAVGGEVGPGARGGDGEQQVGESGHTSKGQGAANAHRGPGLSWRPPGPWGGVAAGSRLAAVLRPSLEVGLRVGCERPACVEVEFLRWRSPVATRPGCELRLTALALFLPHLGIDPGKAPDKATKGLPNPIGDRGASVLGRDIGKDQRSDGRGRRLGDGMKVQTPTGLGERRWSGGAGWMGKAGNQRDQHRRRIGCGREGMSLLDQPSEEEDVDHPRQRDRRCSHLHSRHQGPRPTSGKPWSVSR